MRSSRDVRIFRRGDQRGPSLVAQILAFSPAQWIRFTSNNVTLNGGGISAAADLSPNARNVSQVTASLQPLFANPGATYDGTDDVLTTATAFLNNVTSFSLFVVTDLTGAALVPGDMVFGDDVSACTLNFGGDAGGLPRMTIRPGGGFITPLGPTNRSGATGRFLFDVRLVNGACRVWDNGVAGTDDNSAWLGGTIPCGAPNVGAGTAAGAGSFPGRVQDVIVFTPAPSLADQAVIRALLAQLDGVTL